MLYYYYKHSTGDERMGDTLLYATLFGLGILILSFATFIYDVGKSLRKAEEQKRKLMDRD
jgi:hypothetical protein